MSRVFKINGQDWYGTEIRREGGSVTLRGGANHWPFPEREFPLEAPGPTDSTGDLLAGQMEVSRE